MGIFSICTVIAFLEKAIIIVIMDYNRASGLICWRRLARDPHHVTKGL
jgi:hypothetical protein